MYEPATKHRRRRFRHVLTPPALLLALVLALVAGCGSDSEKEPRSSTEHNDADVTFATDMIQHHAQALAMVNLTVQRPMDPEFQALTERIRDAQAPEIETMTDWLEEWDEEVPETVNDHMNHDMGTMPEGTEDMPGMMSAEEMDGLENAPDTRFQVMWLEMMIRHHEGAVEMARTEESEGRYLPAVELARSIISSQEDEIAEMEALVDRL